jgi:hypothetical protein
MAKTQVTTSNAQPTATPQAAAPAPHKEKKIDLAKPIFDRVMAMTAEQLGGKTPRRVFMDLAATELDMGERGANTYFQNLKNEAEGKGRYPYSPSSKAPTAQAAPIDPANVSLGDVMQAVQVLGTQVSQLNKTVRKQDRTIAGLQHPGA